MNFIAGVPGVYLLSVVAIFGLIIGSFLDVFISRFHTGASLSGRSRCMSCGHTLSWYELFPLLSYLLLRGACRSCGSYIPLRLLVMEIITAGAFAFIFLFAPSFLMLIFGLCLVSLFLVIAVYDMRHMVIPHVFVFLVCAFGVAYVAYEAFLLREIQQLVLHIVSAFLASFFYASLWFVSKGKWIGLGDAKLAFPLALMLTPYSAFSFVVFSFWVGAGLSVLLLAIQKLLQSGKQHLPFLANRLTMKSEVPFAPFMLLAFLLVFFARVDVFMLMMQLL